MCVCVLCGTIIWYTTITIMLMPVNYVFVLLERCLATLICSLWICTRSDNRIMILVPRKCTLFIHQLQCGHLQSTSLVPAHNFPSRAAIVCSIPGTQLLVCRFRHAVQPSGCLLLAQNVVVSLPILLSEIKRSRKVRDQVSQEVAASP